MSWLNDVRERFSSLFLRNREERCLHDELRFHLEMEEAEGLKGGLSPAEARRRARLKLGGVEQTMESFRDARGVRPVEDLARDIRLALRSFTRSPGFLVTAVAVLGLGIGANTAIFSAVRAVILEPLPFAKADQLYLLWESNSAKGWEQEMASPANFLDWKERVPAFADVEAFGGQAFKATVSGLDQPHVLSVVNVTGGFFEMVGVRPMLGREFSEENTWGPGDTPEAWAGHETQLLLSARAWHRLFGGNPNAVGRTLEFNDAKARVVGVMPEGFGFPDENVDAWVPFSWAPGQRDRAWFRTAHYIRPIARLAPGVTPERANAELRTVAAQLEQEQPDANRLTSAGMTPLQQFLIGDTRTPLMILLGAVGLLLLIACANVGNLLLVRVTGRRRDLAVRSALGAGRGRLVRQLLAESLVLAALGGAAGIGLGLLGTRLLERLQPEGLLRVSTFPVNGAVIVFSVLASAIAALLFGAFPIRLVPKSGAGEALREGGRSGSTTRHMQRVVSGFVVAEVALAVLLVLGAGLLVRSIVALRQVEPGFDAEGVVAVELCLPGARYPGPAPAIAFYDELLARIRTLPGVQSAGASSSLPLRDRGGSTEFSIAGRHFDEFGSEVIVRSVTPGYFETMRVPVLRGRAINQGDNRGTVSAGAWDAGAGERVVVVNEAFAREFFPGNDAIGKRITLERQPDSTAVWRTIVGVVGSERQSAIATPPQIELIESFAQAMERHMYVYIRVPAGEPIAVVPQIRAIVQELDAELPLHNVIALTDLVADSIARDRFLMLLLGAFALVALVLALVGVYGVTAQMARQRLPELGLRLALGADPRELVRSSIGRTFVLVGGGIMLGIATALVATRALRGVLFGVAPHDPLTFAVVAIGIGTAGLLASWIPARRAASIDPARTLRAE